MTLKSNPLSSMFNYLKSNEDASHEFYDYVKNTLSIEGKSFTTKEIKMIFENSLDNVFVHPFKSLRFLDFDNDVVSILKIIRIFDESAYLESKNNKDAISKLLNYYLYSTNSIITRISRFHQSFVNKNLAGEYTGLVAREILRQQLLRYNYDYILFESQKYNNIIDSGIELENTIKDSLVDQIYDRVIKLL